MCKAIYFLGQQPLKPVLLPAWVQPPQPCIFTKSLYSIHDLWAKFNQLITRRFSKVKQYSISFLLVVLTSILCSFLEGYIGYRAVALILLLAVSINAILFDIYPVLLSALLSAIIWNFFFIPPLFTLHISAPEDALMFLMYFVIASINAVLTFKIRDVERKEREDEEKSRAITLYNTLLNSLSHELRTPISAIIGAVDTLRENKDYLSLDNQNELLNQINIAGLRLNRQVENLLNMSRLENGMLKLHLDWCDVNELIFSVLQKLSPPPVKQKLIFVPNEHIPLFKLDAGLMEQILHNIMHNAILYTPEDAVINVEARHDNEQCILIISDNGPGIPESEIPFVFDKFYRVSPGKSGGNGLGLSIVKGIVEAHKGTVKAMSNVNGGVTFIAEIPAEASYINNLKNE